MFITATVRRGVLRLLNVSEAARHLGIPIQHLHDGIRAGRVTRPQMRIGKRWYYHAEELPDVAKQIGKSGHRR
jgi:predicted site-specific integrase-resolvase